MKHADSFQLKLSSFFSSERTNTKRAKTSDDGKEDWAVSESVEEEPVPGTSSQTESQETDCSPSKLQCQRKRKLPNDRKFQPHWLNDFDWLEYDGEEDNMTCKFCVEQPQLAGKTDFVTGSRSFKRENLTAHGKSGRHVKCRDSVVGSVLAGTRTIPSTFEAQETRQKSANVYETKVKINTAYCIAKEEMPFTRLKPLILLQKRMALTLVLHMTMMWDVQSWCQRSPKICRTVRRVKWKSVISLPLWLMAQQIPPTRKMRLCTSDMRDGEPVNSLVCLSEVSHAHADGIVDCIGTSMVQFGLENWKEKLVGFCVDGANVNLGQTNGVVAKLREDNSKLIDIHCMAHRLELALMGVLKQNKMVSLVNDTLYLVWKTYNFRPKSSCELKQVCYELETRFYKPKPVKGTRWVPHLDRALKVFLKGENDLVNKAGGFSAVAIHMENLGETSRNADVSGRGKEVSKTMKDLLFVAFCHFLSDVFQEVGALSLTLQKP